MNKNNYAVIMAGGVGSRFYPMSTKSNPKQFIDILGTGETLIQQTFRRLNRVVPKENIYVVTNAIYKEQTHEQLPALKDYQVLCEPLMRNTAPCIAYATYKINSQNPNARVIVAPSDHHITDEDEFYKDAAILLDIAGKNDCLYTLGIRPTRPDTGYGYIQYEEKEDTPSIDGIFKVKTFTEKPNLELAKAFLESGDFLWNSGIFVWSVKSIMAAFEEFLPEMHIAFSEMTPKYYTDQEDVALNEIYPSCAKESIDFGVMEKAHNVYVLPATFGWSDLGTWRSLYEKLPRDFSGNAIVRGNVNASSDCRGNIFCTDGVMLVKGLENYIIADVDGVLVICPKDEEQSVKQMITDAKVKGSKLDI
ncbi:MAG: mannose-1-phosphate guanylyltransferase [Flavobacteriales bacterium]|nr:mannose-1-phosphate guanylyltransferase [Flavobacteriales bacterium]